MRREAGGGKFYNRSRFRVWGLVIALGFGV